MGCAENRQESPEEVAMINCEQRLGYCNAKIEACIKKFDSLASQDNSITKDQLLQALEELSLQKPQFSQDQQSSSQRDAITYFYLHLQKPDKTFDCFDLQIASILLGQEIVVEKGNILAQLLMSKTKEDPKYISRIQIAKFVVTALRIVVDVIPEMIVDEQLPNTTYTISIETKISLQSKWNQVRTELSQQLVNQIISSTISTQVHIDHFLNVLSVKITKILSTKGIRTILKDEEFRVYKAENGL